MEVIVLKERLKELRKSLGLSQEAFGKRLGVTKASISRLENGANSFTEQMIKSICREFNVNYIWFVEGQGSAEIESDIDYTSRIDQIMAGENEFAKATFKIFARFEEEDWKALQRLIRKYLEIEKETPSF